MSIVKRVLRKLRHQRRPQKRDTSNDWLMDIMARQYKEAFWERDKKIVREANFRKAQLVRNENLERQRLEREAEAERQSAIAENRMKNLKKARRRLRWLRSKEE